MRHALTTVDIEKNRPCHFSWKQKKQSNAKVLWRRNKRRTIERKKKIVKYFGRLKDITLKETICQGKIEGKHGRGRQ